MKVKFFAFLIMALSHSIYSLNQIVLTEKWEYTEDIPGRIQYSTIDKDGCPVACFFKIGNRMLLPKKVIPITPIGQGPDEVMNVASIFIYQGIDLAVGEDPSRIKVFQKDNESYKFKKNIWLKRGPNFHLTANTLYFDKKIFISGFEMMSYNPSVMQISYVKVYDEDGNYLKNLLNESIPTEILKTKNIVELRRYILNYKDKIYYLVENDLKVNVISGRNLTEEGQFKLKLPDFYKKMPDDFFLMSKPGESFAEKELNMEHWLVSYSRITKTVVEKDWLIIQVRTCNPKLKRFSLLFYNAGNFNLEKTFFIDDLLLGAKDGKLYCYGDGDPGLDDEVVKTVIKIYSIK